MWVCVSLEEPELKALGWGGDVWGLLVCGCPSAAQWSSAAQLGSRAGMPWVTASCRSVDQEAAVAAWAGCLLKG